MAFQQLIPGGPSVQDDLSQVIPGGPSIAVGSTAVVADLIRATEASSARSISALRLVDLSRAGESDSARNVAVTQTLYADLLRAAETSSARVLSHGPAQMLYLSLVDVAYAHGPEDIEYEVEVEDIAA